jgi:hypothetical protein
MLWQVVVVRLRHCAFEASSLCCGWLSLLRLTSHHRLPTKSAEMCNEQLFAFTIRCKGLEAASCQCTAIRRCGYRRRTHLGILWTVRIASHSSVLWLRQVSTIGDWESVPKSSHI